MPVSKDGKITKSMKEPRDKKSPQQLERALEAEQDEDESPKKESPAATPTPTLSQSQSAVIIDGKTFTCAACKAGHRVGVCKHAASRPMKPTQPPGRPHAGHKKKHICECPKTCRCSARSCRCPRACACTQVMYMLVYIPTADESPKAEESKEGEWKIDREVITDLKGNVLSPEEIQQRAMLKAALEQPPPPPPAPIVQQNASQTLYHPPDPLVSSPSQAKPKASGGCCSHKQKVQEERAALKTGPQQHIAATSLNSQSASSHGCNCGASCSCAFCPQHPNNQTSIDLARQQAMHFANQQLPANAPIIPFSPSVEQKMSCMGGAPRFAISRYPSQPSLADFGQAFATPTDGGFMLAYPFTQKGPFETSHSPQLVDQSHAAFDPAHDMTAIPPLPTMTNPDPGNLLDPADEYLQFFPEDFDIGSAIVASGGPNGWTSDSFGQEHMQNTSQHMLPMPGTFMPSQDLTRTVPRIHGPELARTPHSSTMFDPSSENLDISQYLDYGADINVAPYTHGTDLGAG